DINSLERKVNEIISRKLPVKKYFLRREEAGKIVDLRKVPNNVENIRIVEIEDFDRRPCKDEHVENTYEIGSFRLKSVSRVGKDRYRFLFFID
ncbi:MAG: hypothetical protein QXY45_03745, partial [Candidatus Aenigmatarchaeota archaeon]